MHAAGLALALAVALHSRSEGRAKFKLDESGLLDAKITLSTLDMPELCDIDLSNSDPAVREERLGVLHACIEREIPQLLRVRADASTPCNVIVLRSGVEKMVVAIDARAQCPAFPDERITIDWGLFAGQPLDHVTVTTFEQPHADPKLVMLSKRSSKLVVDVARPLWPKVAAGSAVVVLFAAALAFLVVKRQRKRAKT